MEPEVRLEAGMQLAVRLCLNYCVSLLDSIVQTSFSCLVKGLENG